ASTANSRWRGRCNGGSRRNTPFQRARNPLRSRSRRCAISSLSDRWVAVWAANRDRLMVLRRTRRRAIGDPIETSAFGCRRYQIEAEFLANDAGEKAAHRVLLPSRGKHHGIDAYATRRA